MQKSFLFLAILLCGCTNLPAEDTTNERISFTSEVNQQFINDPARESCDDYQAWMGGELNLDPSTETVTYQNDDYGFSADLPFNPAWGSPRYAALPYEESVAGDEEPSLFVGFGRLLPLGPCGFSREYHIYTDEPMTAQELKADAMASLQSDFPDGSIPEEYLPQVVNVGTRDAVLMRVLGMCSSVELAIPGPQYTYRIAPSCGSGTKEEVDVLMGVGESMQF